jgi:SAM-dependent methyltransferase
VLERLADIAPKYLRNDDPRGPVSLIFERTLEGNTRWGGDYTFCRKWRALGGRIYIDPEMGLDHYGDAMFSGSVAGSLRRKYGLTFSYAFDRIKSGGEPFSVYTELVEAWDNKWSLPADMLSIVAKLGRDAGSVIEFGSGLTTAVLARVCDDVTAHEHDAQWLEKTAPLLEGTSADLILSPLEDGFYSGVSGKYDLAVCDGPPRHVSNGRAGLYAVLGDVLKPGGKFIIDDLDSEEAVSAFLAWAEIWKPLYKIVTGARTFVVGQMK